MDFLGVGAPELILILVVALIILGPERLPETAMKVGKAIQEFRRVTSGVTEQISRELQIEEWQRQARQMEEEARKATQLFPPAPSTDAPPVQAAPPSAPSTSAYPSPVDPDQAPVADQVPPSTEPSQTPDLPLPGGTVPNRSADVFGRPTGDPERAPENNPAPTDPSADPLDGRGQLGDHRPANGREGREEATSERPPSTDGPASRVPLDPAAETRH